MAALRDELVEGALDREIAEKVFAAIDDLFRHDAVLFEVDANAFRGELGYRHALFLRFACGTDKPAVVTADWYGREDDA